MLDAMEDKDVIQLAPLYNYKRMLKEEAQREPAVVPHRRGAF